MRWSKNKPSIGDMRIVKIFLSLPLSLHEENRWLETCYIRQFLGEATYGEDILIWRHQEFVEKADYLEYMKKIKGGKKKKKKKKKKKSKNN